jgi:hypothetical protein
MTFTNLSSQFVATVSPEPRCRPFQIGFLLQVGGFAGGSICSRAAYRRQREYPHPPPPTKNSTTITINKVSIESLLYLSCLSYLCKCTICAKPWHEGKGCVSDSFLKGYQNETTTRVVKSVETLDQRVESDQVKGRSNRLIKCNHETRENLGSCAATNHAIVD